MIRCKGHTAAPLTSAVIVNASTCPLVAVMLARRCHSKRTDFGPVIIGPYVLPSSGDVIGDVPKQLSSNSFILLKARCTPLHHSRLPPSRAANLNEANTFGAKLTPAPRHTRTQKDKMREPQVRPACQTRVAGADKKGETC